MKSAFLRDFGTLYVNLHNVSESDHDKCGIKLNLSKVGVHSYVVLGSFIGCHGIGSQELIKKEGKWTSFVICVILKCHLPPVNTPKDFSMVIKNFIALFLIN